MQIRSYQPGDELAQARIYNTAAASLPGFKPGKPEEIARRIHAGDSDPLTMFYAIENSEVVGYAVFTSNGRISFPWCLPGARSAQKPLLETILATMKTQRFPEAWAAYRGDWAPVLDFMREHRFTQHRVMINYLTETSRLPTFNELPANRIATRLQRHELPALSVLAPAIFGTFDLHTLEHFFWQNPFYAFPDRLLALKEADNGQIRGVSILVADDRFADPTKIDASMPCFRLGAFGTEHQRHKRINGLYSCVFADEKDGDLLLAASLAADSRNPALNHLAAQAPSDAPILCAWYDRFFTRQGSFPILSRPLSN
jgi:hypothetical protein